MHEYATNFNFPMVGFYGHSSGLFCVLIPQDRQSKVIHTCLKTNQVYNSPQLTRVFCPYFFATGAFK